MLHKDSKSMLHHGAQIQFLWPIPICFQLILLPQSWVLLNYKLRVLLEEGEKISSVLPALLVCLNELDCRLDFFTCAYSFRL